MPSRPRSARRSLPRRIRRLLGVIEHARQELRRARLLLARHARRAGEHDCVSDDWHWAHQLIEARRERLLERVGTMGYGLSSRHRGGCHVGTPCLAVYVERKLPRASLARRDMVQKAVHHGNRRLPIDVVELGPLTRLVAPGDAIGPAPLSERATLGAFARDFASGRVVALTAMHATQIGEFPAPGVSPVPFQSPVPGTLFGALIAGSMRGIDAAKLALDTQPPDATTILPGIGPLRGWRPVTYPGDLRAAVRMFGASSGLQTGTLITPAASLPNENLTAAILVDVATQPGDSGSALVDAEGLLLGFLVGRANLAVFTPASLVLSRLGCDVPAG